MFVGTLDGSKEGILDGILDGDFDGICEVEGMDDGFIDNVG